MRSSKYTEHYTDTFITFKEIMRTVSNIYHNCVPDKIKNRRNTDQLKQRDTVIIACVIWGIISLHYQDYSILFHQEAHQR